MGFWGSLGKIVAGKPVYDDTSVRDRLYPSSEDTQASAQPPKSTFIDANGNKIVPEVSFKRLKAHANGSRVTVRAWATNDSQFELELTKIELLGQHRDIRRRLRPSESHEVIVYDGAVRTHDHDRHARLYYKIHQNDDLFLADYEIEYHRESNGTYTLEDLHRDNGPRDI